MRINKTTNYDLLKKTGLKENVVIGNSKRTVALSENKKTVKNNKSSRIIKKSGNCSGCSRNKKR